MTTISTEEKARLPGGHDTARLQSSEDEYVVILEAFHQLHCLNALRKEFYEGRENGTRAGFKEAGGHADHCFSYLLQSLKCHADVGVMTTRWDDKRQVYHANFDVTRQCRNYEAIREWAKGRKPKIS